MKLEHRLSARQNGCVHTVCNAIAPRCATPSVPFGLIFPPKIFVGCSCSVGHMLVCGDAGASSARKIGRATPFAPPWLCDVDSVGAVRRASPPNCAWGNFCGRIMFGWVEDEVGTSIIGDTKWMCAHCLQRHCAAICNAVCPVRADFPTETLLWLIPVPTFGNTVGENFRARRSPDARFWLIRRLLRGRTVRRFRPAAAGGVRVRARRWPCRCVSGF